MIKITPLPLVSIAPITPLPTLAPITLAPLAPIPKVKPIPVAINGISPGVAVYTVNGLKFTVRDVSPASNEKKRTTYSIVEMPFGQHDIETGVSDRYIDFVLSTQKPATLPTDLATMMRDTTGCVRLGQQWACRLMMGSGYFYGDTIAQSVTAALDSVRKESKK